MGVCSHREQLSEAELEISAKELTLKYSQLSAEYVDLVFRKYSRDAVLNEVQFRDAVKLLGLQVIDTSANNKTEEFYCLMKRGALYVLERLLVLGVLLGTGSISSKANLLFEVYDTEGTHQLSQDAVRTMCQDVFGMAVSCLPVLTGLSGVVLLTYIHRLRLQQAGAETLLESLILGKRTEVTQEEFVSAFDKAELSQLLTSQGVRTFIIKAKGFQKSIFYVKRSQSPPQATQPSEQLKTNVRLKKFARGYST
jgi:hypothetical protein